MAHEDGEKRHWDDHDRFYSSGSHSDESPILSYRCEKRRYAAYTSPRAHEERERRSTLSVLGKFCLFCAAMILFCVLMYIPVYNKANYHIPRKGFVAGWSIHTNRDTKIYVQPNNVTTVYEPNDVCRTKNNANKLLLLVIVCSATDNFERRAAIRETWGSHLNYKKNLVIFKKIREKYKDYNFKYNLYPQKDDLKVLEANKVGNGTVHENVTDVDDSAKNVRKKRDISSFHQLLPVLAKALSNISLTSNSKKTDDVPEKRFDDDDDDDGVVPGFDMNKELDDTNNIDDFDYNYDSNIMKIPPRGYEDDEENSPDLNSVLNLLKQSKDFEKIKEDIVENEDPDFRLVFLLGMPSKDNGTVQKRIEDEIDEYSDIVQEGFIDSYNNLTLKSIMMLKWVTRKCNESVRYILKTDDDTYVNVPNLILNLKNRSEAFDKMAAAKGRTDKEYLLIGDIISGARPVLDSESKWYSPRYMYGGRVYPRYLSGMGYAMSAPTALALYNAALRTHYFHLEDIYITAATVNSFNKQANKSIFSCNELRVCSARSNGASRSRLVRARGTSTKRGRLLGTLLGYIYIPGMCALRASPRITARDEPLFSYLAVRGEPCSAHAQITAHRVTADDMRAFHARLTVEGEVDRCERMRLTKVRQDELRRKAKQKKLLAAKLLAKTKN